MHSIPHSGNKHKTKCLIHWIVLYHFTGKESILIMAIGISSMSEHAGPWGIQSKELIWKYISFYSSVPYGKLPSIYLRCLAKSKPVKHSDSCQLYSELWRHMQKNYEFNVIWAAKQTLKVPIPSFLRQQVHSEWPVWSFTLSHLFKSNRLWNEMGSNPSASLLLILSKWLAQFLGSHLKHRDNYRLLWMADECINIGLLEKMVLRALTSIRLFPDFWLCHFTESRWLAIKYYFSSINLDTGYLEETGKDFPVLLSVYISPMLLSYRQD
jgi:hypothetical protein